MLNVKTHFYTTVVCALFAVGAAMLEKRVSDGEYQIEAAVIGIVIGSIAYQLLSRAFSSYEVVSVPPQSLKNENPKNSDRADQ